MSADLPFDVPLPRTAARFIIELPLRTVTPILGGGTRKRAVDPDDPIRATGIRGHLRMWWRATLQGLPATPDLLWQRERQIWGGVSGASDRGDNVLRSRVRVAITEVRGAERDTSDIGFRDSLAYALWPARKTHAEPPAPRWKPGLCFTLRVSGPATVDHGRVDAEAEVRRALTAWLLFGGYGGRTRRGLGAVAIDDPELRRSWLPAKATVEALRDIFPGFGRPTEEQRRSLPRLTGAALALGRLGRDGDQAAAQALDWLRQFRQGYAQGGAFGEHDPSFARVAGERNRPSVSNWPEPDKLRRLMQGRWSHTPRHLDDPAWPRAGFGLPIQIRWQRRARDGGRHYEPDDVRLEWREPGGASHDRLGSPLFVGPLQTQDGRFSPFALWLHRAYPTGGQVVAVGDDK